MRMLRLLVASGVVALSACGGIDLDPSTHRELPRATAEETRPPADLLSGQAK